MSNLNPADPVVRELRFARPTPKDGEQARIAGRLFEGFGGDWWERDERMGEEVRQYLSRMSRSDRRRADLFRRWAEMQRKRTTDFRGVLPEECAVEVVDEARGTTRTDYRNVPIKNADGTLNKYGKALIEAHETQNRAESELAAEINATPSGG